MVRVIEGPHQHVMKILRTIVLILGFTLATSSRAADEKTDSEKDKASAAREKTTRDMVDRLLGEVQKATSKVEGKTKELWTHGKDMLTMKKEDYLKRATSGLATMDAEVQALAESDSGVVTREYFKMRIESLKKHIDYCKRDLERLKATDSEEAFRVKQKGFDRALGFLGDSISLAKDEAGN